jgi:hypothetical protein
MENNELFKKALAFYLREGDINGFQSEYNVQNKIMEHGIKAMTKRIDLQNPDKYDKITKDWVGENFSCRFSFIPDSELGKIKSFTDIEDYFYDLKELYESDSIEVRAFFKDLAFEDQLFRSNVGKLLNSEQKRRVECKILILANKFKNNGLSPENAFLKAKETFRDQEGKIEEEEKELTKNEWFHIKLRELNEAEFVSVGNDGDLRKAKRLRQKWLKQATKLMTYNLVNQDLGAEKEEYLTKLQCNLIKGIKNNDILVKKGSVANLEILENEIADIFFSAEELVSYKGKSIGIFEIFNYLNCNSLDDVLQKFERHIGIFQRQIADLHEDARIALEESDIEFKKKINSSESAKEAYKAELIKKIDQLDLEINQLKIRLYENE